MSQETLSWLNTMVLVGNTKLRRNFVDPTDPAESRMDSEGRAWHYRANEQGAEPNHYPGAIPVEDIIRRLFHWTPLEIPLEITVPEITADGVDSYVIVEKGSKHIVRPRGTFGPKDPGARLGTFKKGYKVHIYKEWLIDNIAMLLDDSLYIGSAGLLKRGAMAFVSIEVPENITTPEGVEFRPRLTGATSLDGSLSSTYKRMVTLPICDNTLRAGLGETGQQVKIRHTANSLTHIKDHRQALALVHTAADDFMAEVASLVDEKVDEGGWEAFKDRYVSLKVEQGKDAGKDKKGRGLTLAMDKRAALDNLWLKDPRVAPWTGTAFGVVQAVNTYEHHIATVRNMEREERNAQRDVDGHYDRTDAEVIKELELALAAA